MRNTILTTTLGFCIISCTNQIEYQEQTTVQEVPLQEAIQPEKQEAIVQEAGKDPADVDPVKYFDSLPARKPLSKAGSGDYKKGNTIILPTEAGEVTFIEDPYSETERSEYTYLGENENIGYYVVSGVFWEHEENYLIDRFTAKVDTIWSAPVFSPNDSLLISKSMDYGLEGVPNGFQIWRLSESRSWEMIFEVDQDQWVPLKFKWISDHKFIIKRTSIENYLENGPGIRTKLEFEEFDTKNL